MFKNYFKIAFRTIKKQKLSSFINIASLVIGMTCCILIFLYVFHEVSYDNFHKNADRIYRTTMYCKMGNSDWYSGEAPGPMATVLRQEYPEVEYSSRIISQNHLRLEVNNSIFNEQRLKYVGNDVFNIISIDFVQGNPDAIINTPYTLLITEEIAQKYFADENPVGEKIKINEKDFEIRGIIKNPPSNMHAGLVYNFVTSIYSYRLKPEEMTYWPNFYGQTFIKLNKGTDAKVFERKIKRIAHEYYGDYFKKRGWTFECFLESISSLHLHSKADPGNSMLNVYSFSIIGFLILCIACFNFINLSTARYFARTKEIGLRKVIGAQRVNIISQFFGESMLLTVIALLTSIPLVLFILPYFNHLIDRQLGIINLFQSTHLFFMLLLLFFVGIFAGSYPSFYLSNLMPALIISNRSAAGSYRSTLRKLFIIFQFSITTVLIIASLVVYNQINYMKNQDLGFDKEQKIIIPARFNNNFESVKSEFLNHPDIVGATASNIPPGRTGSSITTRLYGEEVKEIVMNYNFIDHDFIPQYKIQMAAGRSFSKNISTDLGKAFILNEAAARAFGWNSPHEAIGKIIEGVGRGDEYKRRIIGITKDSHYQGLQKEIKPLVMLYNPDRFYTLSLTVRAENLRQIISFIETKWGELHLGSIFSFSFLDENLNRLYASEEKIAVIFITLTFLAIFISCMGLFGMAAILVEQRTKEIGVRKVLGASVPDIIRMLTQKFAVLVLSSNLIAWPIAYFFMNKWLQNFAFKIKVGIPIFIFATIIVFLIAFLTVSYQSIRAALANPVDALKYE